MARKKGREIHGWLIVDKPAGIGSTDVVSRVRWALDAKKAGHAGTLDPDATGVLAIALGEATKTVPILTDALKAYDFTVNWGAETATDDASGAVIRSAETRPSADEIRAAARWLRQQAEAVGVREADAQRERLEARRRVAGQKRAADGRWMR